MTSPVFRIAHVTDADAIADLVNAAYRGESSRRGWTTEADLLDGRRTTADEIRQLIRAPDSIILLCTDAGGLLGSVHVAQVDRHAHIGMFVVSPPLQGKGVGKQLLEAAERTAQQEWSVRQAVMHVITRRAELIAFYERRGYVRTGVCHAFPENPAMWIPKVTDLQLEVLEKQLSDASAVRGT